MSVAVEYWCIGGNTTGISRNCMYGPAGWSGVPGFRKAWSSLTRCTCMYMRNREHDVPRLMKQRLSNLLEMGAHVQTIMAISGARGTRVQFSLSSTVVVTTQRVAQLGVGVEHTLHASAALAPNKGSRGDVASEINEGDRSSTGERSLAQSHSHMPATGEALAHSCVLTCQGGPSRATTTSTR
jgi:hypothetical protein